jgi:hypothetical protein
MSDDPLAKFATARLLGLITTNDKTHYEALGRFIASYASAEGAAHAVARKLSGLSDEKARLVFVNMRLADLIDRIRSIIEFELNRTSVFPTENLKDVGVCLDQLHHITTRRHKLVHRGATYFSGALISSNAMIAKTLASSEMETIAQKTLDNMQLDCGAIFLRLIYIAQDDRKNDSFLQELRQRPWRYKPPPPKNKNLRRRKDSGSPLPQPRASRASRRREAMKKRETP